MAAVGWHDKIRRQLEVVQRWRQSGKSIAQWAPAHGVDPKLLMGWVTYEKRWRQRLGQCPQQSQQLGEVGALAIKAAVKVREPAPIKAQSQGFVAVRRSDTQTLGSAAANAAPQCATGLAQPNSASVRIECAVAGLGGGLVSRVQQPKAKKWSVRQLNQQLGRVNLDFL